MFTQLMNQLEYALIILLGTAGIVVSVVGRVGGGYSDRRQHGLFVMGMIVGVVVGVIGVKI